jgi:hypothetical protein
MHRRHVLALVAPLVTAPHLATARQFEVAEPPAPDLAALQWEAIRFQHRADQPPGA